MGYFTQDANADTVATESTPGSAVTPQNDIVGMVVPFVFIFIVFYFLIIRPQQRKLKTHQAMVSGIQRGDKIITSGGIHGKVSKVNADDNTVHVEIADGVVVKVHAPTISTVLGDKPINDNSADKKKA